MNSVISKYQLFYNTKQGEKIPQDLLNIIEQKLFTELEWENNKLKNTISILEDALNSAVYTGDAYPDYENSFDETLNYASILKGLATFNIDNWPDEWTSFFETQIDNNDEEGVLKFLLKDENVLKYVYATTLNPGYLYIPGNFGVKLSNISSEYKDYIDNKYITK